jgi:2-(3-amino-3-carboxypropyl)histidine synthase
MLKGKRVGVCTTIQHLDRLPEALSVLSESGFQAVVGEPGGRIRNAGQVLGCCYAPAKISSADELLFIGTGLFHPLGMALSTKKRVIAVDPVSLRVEEIDPSPLLRRRYGAIARAMDAKSFAVLVSKKPGQERVELARRLEALGRKAGLEMTMVLLDNIEPDRLLNLGIEAAVSTACPRVALDDSAKFRIPLLTPPEFEIVLKERKWEDYSFDEIDTF